MKSYGQDKVSFREIVLAHIKKILELSTHELRNTTTETIHNSHTQVSYNEDTRRSYIQAIQNFSFILVPHFDKEAQEVYDECNKVLEKFEYKICKEFKEEYDELYKNVPMVEDFDKQFALIIRIKYAQKLFIELNKLLKRNNYLKTSIYSEADLEDDDEDEDA